MPLETLTSYLGFKNSQQKSDGFVREGIVISYEQASNFRSGAKLVSYLRAAPLGAGCLRDIFMFDGLFKGLKSLWLNKIYWTIQRLKFLNIDQDILYFDSLRQSEIHIGTCASDALTVAQKFPPPLPGV